MYFFLCLQDIKLAARTFNSSFYPNNKREWDVCLSVDILVVRAKLLNHN